MTKTTKEEATAILSAVVKAIVETVNEMPNGAPAGPMYAAFMSKGMSLETFQSITSMLVEMKMIARRGDQFFPVTETVQQLRQRQDEPY